MRSERVLDAPRRPLIAVAGAEYLVNSSAVREGRVNADINLIETDPRVPRMIAFAQAGPEPAVAGPARRPLSRGDRVQQPDVGALRDPDGAAAPVDRRGDPCPALDRLGRVHPERGADRLPPGAGQQRGGPHAASPSSTTATTVGGAEHWRRNCGRPPNRRHCPSGNRYHGHDVRHGRGRDARRAGIEAFFPADEETGEYLRERAARG
jgi:hypothetical protein